MPEVSLGGREGNQRTGSDTFSAPMPTPSQLVGAQACINLLFPDEASRPALRTFRKWQANRYFPVHKIGRSTFFDPEQVRAALDRRFKIHPTEV